MKSRFLLLLLLTGSVFIAGCGESDSETSMRNLLLVDEATASSEVSKDSPTQDDDYNDPVASSKMVCVVGDNQVSTVSVALAPVVAGAKNDQGLVIRLPKVGPGKTVEHNGNKVLTKTIYLTNESTSADLCENLKPNLRAIVAENEAHLLAALESAKPQKGQLPKGALEDLLSPSTPPKLLHEPPIESNAGLYEVNAAIQLVVLAKEGEPTAELTARQQAILTAINICPSRIEAMRNSHPLGPFALRVKVLSVSGVGLPSKCLLGLGELDHVSVSPTSMGGVTWGEICGHPHGTIRIPEGSSCAAAGFE